MRFIMLLRGSTTLGLAANYYNLSNLPLPVPDPPASAKPFDLIVAGDTFPRTGRLLPEGAH